MKSKGKLSFGLTGNMLKIIALITMTFDHIGVQLFPQYEWLRIVGRLSFPLFAYMIAEGCRYTKNRAKYLGMIAGLGVVCQLVYFFAMNSLYQCILITFSLSIVLIYSIDFAVKRQKIYYYALPVFVFASVYFIVAYLPLYLDGFYIDYGIWGILTPVFAYIFKNKWLSIGMAALPLTALAITNGNVQWVSMFSLLLLALYNGKRGKWRIKHLFYIYYPLHLVLIYLISMLI